MPKASSNRGTLIVLAYLWPLVIVPLLVRKHDRDVRWHAAHGLLLMAFELLAFAAMWVAIAFVTVIAFGVGMVLSLCLVFAWIAVLGLRLVAIVRELNGRRLVVPGVSVFADRL
jgi:uncharacterized membrane protein